MVDMEKKSELIFISSTLIGHLSSTMELAQILINSDNHLSITILIIKHQATPFSESYIRTVLASQPQIQIIDVEPPPEEEQTPIPQFTASFFWSFMEWLKPHVKSTMQNILSSYPNTVVGLVLDFLCVPFSDVGKDLGIPSYLFFPSNAGFLSICLHFQKCLIEDVLNNSDPELLIQGFPSLVPSSVIPDVFYTRDEEEIVTCGKFTKKNRETKGIIINTLLELEQYGIDALTDGQTPPIYHVGPLIGLKGLSNPSLDQVQHNRLLKWLDEQPPSSVAFLCFGSMGSFDPSQTREIALGLQRSGVRFLWALRSPPTTDNKAEKTLPEGFLEWTELEGRGMLCEWAPQVEVMAHKAIGGFVSHCGWNSILESLWFGVPILTWPIYGEQQLNAFRMVREWGLAVELRVDYRRGDALVMADEIEKGLKYLMDKDNMVHKKVQEMKEMARKAVLSGGSSFISVRKLIDDMIGCN
ncbi:UDP-glycosyltransferase 71K2-like [Lotus japonicus]|uniref:UDP-glycosyltransferase 71K2-like n=1 Tax=Lotus japonicus TaxID=34305 RepID=UPI0025862C87|nr:UDP-glycosyltransferase 71K2-like [Lotus japonicus]